jgi:SLT domain-containing protein
MTIAVQFTKYSGGGTIADWIESACAAAKVPFSGYWLRGMETLTRRESSWLPNAINHWDSNATGPIVGDGYPQNCSRGLAQVIPPTFVAYHADETSDSIYDPVANIAASIGYIRARYGVAEDGRDLAAKVQQADPKRSPRGY